MTVTKIALSLLVVLTTSVQLFAASSVEFGGKGSTPGQFGDKIHLAFDNKGTIYVSDPDNFRVQVFSPQGDFLRSIAPSEEDAFQFNRIGELAVSPHGVLSVADWKTELISGAGSNSRPKIYFLTPCIHRFDVEGSYVSSIPIDSVAALKERKAIPALDRKGEAAFVIRPDDFDRPLHLASDHLGNLYILEEKRDVIYRYDPSGNLRLEFGGFGQLDSARGIDCDPHGNVYVADCGNNRIVRFDADGKLVLWFGKKGRQDAEFICPYLVRVTDDGTILVWDQSSFKRVFTSYLPKREDDPSQQDLPDEEQGKGYVTWIRRLQRFRPDGKFKEKILLRFQEQEKSLRLIAIDREENLYFFDPETHRIKVQKVPRSSLHWGDIQKSYKISIEKGIGDIKLDAGGDIDLGYNYLYNLELLNITQLVLFKYHLTERVGTSLEGRLSYLHAYRQVYYPQEKPQAGEYVYDSLLFDDFLRGRIKVDLKIVLDQNPYEYRQMDLFLSLGGSIYDFNWDMIDRENLMHGLWHLWQQEIGAGISWDVKRDFNFYFGIFMKLPSDYMAYRYKYWNQEGRLSATGSFGGKTTIAYSGINVVF